MNSEIAAGNEFENDSNRVRWHNLCWSVERSIRYYRMRRQWWSNWLLAFQVTTGLCGSIGVLNVVGGASSFVGSGLVGLAGVVGTVGLVLQLNQRINLYQRLLERTLDLSQKAASGTQDYATLIALEKDGESINRDLPEQCGVLDTICHNQVAQAWGYGRIYPITMSQRIFKQFLTEYRVKPPSVGGG